jgi:drug/metabolite transporter (DMT)-like permease
MSAPEAVADEGGSIAAQVPDVPAVPHRLDPVGVLLVAFGAVAFSGKAIIVKLGFRLGADAITLLALRMAVALPFFLLIGVWAARRAPALARGDRWRIVALGVCGYYLASLLDFLGLAYISATLERVILYLTPTFVLLFGALLAHRRPTRRQLVALAISYLGVLLAFGHDLGVAGEDVVRGGLLVLGSAVSYAIYLYGSGEIVARVGAVRLTAYASTVASVLCIGQYLLLEPSGMPALPGAVYGLSLLNGTVCTVLPVLATMIGVRRIGSGPASQIGMIGPVSTILLSLLILHEPMGPWQIAGTALVVMGVLTVSRSKAV